MKNILGLDIGTNSIGWALVEHDISESNGKIIALGSRIIPMDGDKMKDFESGKSVSNAAERRKARGARRLLQRYKLRRTRLIRVLKILKWIPETFPENFKYLEKHNINDYIPISEQIISEASSLFNTSSVSQDWMVYYLRFKALREKISLPELARVLYHLNQKRGYKSSRKEKSSENSENEESSKKIQKKVEIVKIVDKQLSEEKNRYGFNFLISVLTSDNQTLTGLFCERLTPEVSDNGVELEIRTEVVSTGEKYSFKLPDRTNWEKMKIALEKDINESGLHIGEYFFNKLLIDRNYIIKERVIDRKFYRNEIKAIWENQKKFHPELEDKSLLPLIASTLYNHNVEKQKEIESNDLFHLFANDIIYYKRDLKSQKHLVRKCSFESRLGSDNIMYGVNVIHRSNPLFQEFRIWQDINNIKIFRNERKDENGKIIFNEEITDTFLDNSGKELLFELFDSSLKVTQKSILSKLSKNGIKLNCEKYHLNYPSEKEFKGNETKAAFRKIFKEYYNDNSFNDILNDSDKIDLLWHIIYSLNEEESVKSALKRNFSFNDELINSISKMPVFKGDYASLSAKAIKKILPLMRTGKFWSSDIINKDAVNRLNMILNDELPEVDKKLSEMISKKNLNDINSLQGLPFYLACYLVYGRNSERSNTEKFKSFEEIDTNKMLPNLSLRNPVVEKITRETLKVVKDIWKTYLQPDEIHIELSRDLKNNQDEKKKITKSNYEKEQEIKRIKEILIELKNSTQVSPADILKLRLWEQTGNRIAKETFPNLSKQPTKTEIEKYRLWGEQNHISPYTGKVIPLSKLFTEEYEVEHIIPRSRFFDDSFANKTICETNVNKFKDNRTAMELIYEAGGTEISNVANKFTLLSKDEYILHIKSTFYGKKRKYFLSESIPEDFVSRQLNDTRYIGKKLAEILYPIAKEDIIFTSGNITSKLRNEWGLGNMWKELLIPRFKRLEQITGEKLIFTDDRNGISFLKDYKRIDHRHHALDALVVALTSRSHIQYLNSLNALSKNKSERDKFFYIIRARKYEFSLPWTSFTLDAKSALQETVVSFKNDNRFLTKGLNRHLKWKFENGQWKRKFVKQDNTKLFSVRTPLFKEPSGLVYLAEYKTIKISKAVELQYKFLTEYKNRLQSRIADPNLRQTVNTIIKNNSFSLDETLRFIKKNPINSDVGTPIENIKILEFNKYAAKRVPISKDINGKIIDSIPYSNHSPLAQLLKSHLKEYHENSETAFTGDGLNNLYVKWGRPIRKITKFENVGNKIELNNKLLEVDKGTNLFFVIYENINTYERKEMFSLPIYEAIERKRNNLPIAENREGFRTIILSPNQLVYVPPQGESISEIDLSYKKKIADNIYKVVSFTGSQCHFLHHTVAKLVLPYDSSNKLGEFESLNKSEKTMDGQMIKNSCIKVEVDRLGNIIIPEL